MSTSITYNGISIPYPRTLDVSDEPVYDGGDYLYTRWTFRVAGVLFRGAYGGSETAPAALARIEHYLEQPRKRLTYVINGTTILDVGPSALLGDVANGPFPEVLSVVRVDGGAAIWVEFRVSAAVRMCPGRTKQPDYLSNRWHETITIDDECRSTRERQGRIVLRSDFVNDPDTFRGIVTPAIPDGFVRESSRYELTDDGLRIQYHFTDKEVYTLPPRGTFKATATYRETCPNGATRHAEVQCAVAGDFRSNRKDLLAIAISIAMQRLNRAGLQRSANGRWLATGSFEENLYEPKVAVNIRAMLRPPKGPADGAAISPGRLGGGSGNVPPGGFAPAVPPGGFGGGILGGIIGGVLSATFPPAARPVDGVNVPGKPSLLAGWGEIPFGSVGAASPDPGVRGTAGLKLLAAALNDPCLVRFLSPGLSTGGQFGIPSVPPVSGTTNQQANQQSFVPVGAGPVPNLVLNQQADLAQSPSAGRAPEGRTVPPASLFVVPSLSDLLWEQRPEAPGVYTDYRITLRVVEDNQTAELPPQIPPLAPGQSPPAGTASQPDYAVAYVNLSAPTLRLIVEWSAERAGQPPENPSKDLGDSNAVYLKGSWNPGGLELASDGFTLIFNTAGRYEYGFKKPALANYGAGIPPWAAELMGVGSRPFVYGTPNVSGIWPGTNSPRQIANSVAPVLPGVPTGEGQPGTQLPSNGGLPPNDGRTLQPSTLEDFLRILREWMRQEQQGGTSGGRPV